MNEQMEKEICRTIQVLQASMPEPKARQTPIFSLLRIAVSDINVFLLIEVSFEIVTLLW